MKVPCGFKSMEFLEDEMLLEHADFAEVADNAEVMLVADIGQDDVGVDASAVQSAVSECREALRRLRAEMMERMDEWKAENEASAFDRRKGGDYIHTEWMLFRDSNA